MNCLEVKPVLSIMTSDNTAAHHTLVNVSWWKMRLERNSPNEHARDAHTRMEFCALTLNSPNVMGA